MVVACLAVGASAVLMVSAVWVWPAKRAAESAEERYHQAEKQVEDAIKTERQSLANLRAIEDQYAECLAEKEEAGSDQLEERSPGKPEHREEPEVRTSDPPSTEDPLTRLKRLSSGVFRPAGDFRRPARTLTVSACRDAKREAARNLHLVREAHEWVSGDLVETRNQRRLEKYELEDEYRRRQGLVEPFLHRMLLLAGSLWLLIQFVRSVVWAVLSVRKRS